MNYTKNYRLPQWVKSDRIMMEDFNAMNSSIESGLTTAVSTANTAKQTADAAKQSADTAYTPSNKPYAIGIYEGNGSADGKTITLGFRPSFVIITCQGFGTVSNLSMFAHFGILALANQGAIGRLNNDGFTVYAKEYNYPQINENTVHYSYIAFR